MPGDATPLPLPQTPLRIARKKESPDLVGEELGDHTRIWREYNRLTKVDDKERIENWNRGLDNLALFAGLFSAVTTGFIIQLQNDTRPDYAELTFRVMKATAAKQPFVQDAFVIDPTVRVTNCLWIASLMLSLTAALIAIMGKDWIGMYASRPVCNPRQWAEMRTYRLSCVEHWYMPGIIAFAPVLLHISLVLFTGGLVVFLGPDPGGVLYFFTVLSSIVFSGSPFKSPATQMVRGAIFALPVLLRSLWGKSSDASQRQDRLFRTDPLLPSHIPLHEPMRLRRFWTSVRALWPSMGIHGHGWRLTLRSRARAVGEAIVATLRSFAVHLHNIGALALEKKRRFPVRVLEHARALKLYLLEHLASNRWADARSTPTPMLLARSVSLLHDMSPTPETLYYIIVALGDLAIGSEVAPLVSSDLMTRLHSEIQQKWRTAELDALCRYILADKNLFKKQAIIDYPHTSTSFLRARKDHPVRSENLLFAYARVKDLPLHASEIAAMCPDTPSHPHAMKFLLPHLAVNLDSPQELDPFIFLASRYYSHDDLSVDMEGILRRFLSPVLTDEFNSVVKKRFGDQSGLLELLVFLLGKKASALDTMHNLIIRVLDSKPELVPHPCLVDAFGGDHPWPALHWPSGALYAFARSLPVLRYRFLKWDLGSSPPITWGDHEFEFALARIVIKILSSENLLQCRYTLLPDDNNRHHLFLDLGMRCLYTQICHPRSLQTCVTKAELIRLILENSVLNESTIGNRYLPLAPKPSERYILNILTAIARHLASLLGRPDTLSAGAPLFCLFSSSEATSDWGGATVRWSLGDYLRSTAARISDGDEDPTAEIAMRRLEVALRALRPFCMVRDDLRAAWEQIGVSANPDANDPYWDCEIGAFFAIVEPHEDADDINSEPDAPPETRRDELTPGYYALLCLEGSMY